MHKEVITSQGHEKSYVFEEGERPFSLIFANTTQACAGEEYIRDKWNCWTFEYVVGGCGMLEVAGESFYPTEGDMYVLPKHLPHRYQSDIETPWQKIYFVIEGNLTESLLRNYGFNKTAYMPNCGCGNLFREIHDIWQRHESNMHDRAAIVFHEILTILSAGQRNKPEKIAAPVQKAITFIRRNIQANVSMDEIADAAQLSRSHLNRIFKEQLGVTPYDYLINIRIDLARDLLLHTDMTISDIADKLCYSDAYYFSNTFKKHTGMSPSHFRNNEK